MNYLGFDITTSAARMVIRKLPKKRVPHVLNKGQYRQDPRYTMVYVDTTMTEKELDEWLYNLKLPIEFDYGTFERTAPDNKPISEILNAS